MPDRYYPRYLGVTTPRGKSVYEFLITGVEEVGILAKVASVFAAHNANLRSVGTYEVGGVGGFVFNMYADLAKADCTPEQLLEELKRIEAVRSADAEDVSEAFFNRFLFPIMMTDDTRAVMVAASALVGVETHFGQSLGQRGRHIMFESGKQAGLSILRGVRMLTQRSSPDGLLVDLRDRLRAAGWGIFSFDVAEIEKGRIEVKVVRPIFSEVEGVQDSWFTSGLAAGAMEGVFGGPLVLTSSSYKRETEELSLTLQEHAEKARPLKGLR